MSLTELSAWQELHRHQRELDSLHMRDLFAADVGRFARFSLECAEILFDYSKNRITEETTVKLFELAEQAKVRAAIDAMFSGAKINVTENRAALHVALRNRSGRAIHVDGRNVMPEVRAELRNMRRFTESVRDGSWLGHTGKVVTDVVNIGIGGSDLGPRMVTRALTPYWHERLRFHFVANVDPSDLEETLRRLEPESTLFLVASKTFTTQETMANAERARAWLLSQLGDPAAVAKHFVAMSTNQEKVEAFGIEAKNMFRFWDWVGGRYSLWSAVGLSIALAISMDGFEQLLAGAHEVDEHFRSAPYEGNVPVIMALLGIWYNNFWGAQSHAVLAYDQYLEHFARHLQQLDMESNGKSMGARGEAITWQTGPIVWGEVGTNSQHAFFQLLHQGTKFVPCDFLAAAKSHHQDDGRHTMLLANFLAQTEALMRGRTVSEARELLRRQGVEQARGDLLAQAKSFAGNKPSNSFLYEKLTPWTLGALIALYEHKVFVQGAIWGINSFDQMGVELGKELAGEILGELVPDAPAGAHDASTSGLIEAYKRWR